MTEKLPCALLINDIHVSKDNISEFHKNWDEALSKCAYHDIHEIIVGGDMWQSRASQTLETLLAVRQALIKAHKADINVTIANGNHDKVNQESQYGYNHIFSEYPDVDIVDDYTILDFSNTLALYVMSYFPENGTFASRLEEISKTLDKKKTNILYCHEGIRGGLATASDDELPTNIFKEFDKVLVGHYHNRQTIKNTAVEYIGSSRQHNFGEDEEKGYTILFDDGSYEFVKNEVNVRYKVIDIELSDMTDAFFKKLECIKSDSRYKVKVRVSCKSKDSQNIDKAKLVEAGATKVELVTEQTAIKLTEAQSIEKKFDKGGIKKEYQNFCADRAISDVEMGLEYLDKIK